MSATGENAVSAPVPLGCVVDGKYRVDRVLGVGGMGVVVSATHLQLHAPVAIKFLLPQVSSNGEARERFLREARAAIQIHSEHVARVLDVDTLDNGTPYLVMEYLEGKDLAALLAEQGRIAVDQAVTYIVQACEALAEAHAIGIIHRDLKPANLFLTRRRNGAPSIKVLDFGISKLSGAADRSSMTRADSMMGSPFYMPPELFVSARNADARSDVWSLGVILYELLAGVPPFRGESLPALCRQVTEDEPMPLASHRPEVPPDVGRIVSVCLTKDPARRYQSVDDLKQALTRAAWQFTPGNENALRTLSSSNPPELAETAPNRTLGGVATTNHGASSRSWRRVALGFGGLGLAGAALLLVRGLLVGGAEVTDIEPSSRALSSAQPRVTAASADASAVPDAGRPAPAPLGPAATGSPGTAAPSAAMTPSPASARVSAAVPPKPGATRPSPARPTDAGPGSTPPQPSSGGVIATASQGERTTPSGRGSPATTEPAPLPGSSTAPRPPSLEELGARRH